MSIPVPGKKTLENSRWAVSGRRSPINLRRADGNYLTNSELEYVVKKDMGCRVEPYGLVSAVSMKQRHRGARIPDTGNSRLDFLARKLDLVTAELNESIGRVSQKKLLQIIDKLNILRSQMNQARYEAELPRRQAIEEAYSPRAVFGDGNPSLPNSARHKHTLYNSLNYTDRQEVLNATASIDEDLLRKEMQKLVEQPSNRRPPQVVRATIRRSGSADDLRIPREPNWFMKPEHKFRRGTDDMLDVEDPLVNEYFPTTARFQSEMFSTEQAWNPPRPGIPANSWRSAPQRPTYDPSKYVSRSVVNTVNRPLTTDDIVNLAEESDYDPATFQLELLRLKADKLRMEEEALLEMRRLAELERLRGPRHKWYELKTPAFWYEASKNNDDLRKSWDDGSYNNYMRQYKNSLMRASTDFGNKWSVRKY